MELLRLSCVIDDGSLDFRYAASHGERNTYFLHTVLELYGQKLYIVKEGGGVLRPLQVFFF
jgi:hypothetical protein